MDDSGIFPSYFCLKLTNCFKERLAFDVSYSTADLDDGDSGFIRPLFFFSINTALDFIRNMRNDLHRTPAVIAVPFLIENGPIDFSGGDIRVLIQTFIDKTLIVSEIQVRLRSVIRDKNFPVLNRVHRSGVHVDVGVEFLHFYGISPIL